MTWHSKWFQNIDEVEYVFGITLWGEQEMMVLEYLKYGIVPDNQGCWTCDRGAVRKLIAKIKRYELALDNGEEKWPWTHIQSPSSGSIPALQAGLPSTSSEETVSPQSYTLRTNTLIPTK